MSLRSVISAGTAAALTLVAFCAVPTAAGATPADFHRAAGTGSPVVIVVGIGGKHHDCGFCGLGD